MKTPAKASANQPEINSLDSIYNTGANDIRVLMDEEVKSPAPSGFTGHPCLYFPQCPTDPNLKTEERQV